MRSDRGIPSTDQNDGTKIEIEVHLAQRIPDDDFGGSQRVRITDAQTVIKYVAASHRRNSPFQKQPEHEIKALWSSRNQNNLWRLWPGKKRLNYVERQIFFRFHNVCQTDNFGRLQVLQRARGGASKMGRYGLFEPHFPGYRNLCCA